MSKISNYWCLKYEKVPLIDNDNDNEVPSFHTVPLDMVGPWEIKFLCNRKKIALDILTLTKEDKATWWPEIVIATCNDAEYVSSLFDRDWLCQNPHPVNVVNDNGGKFTGFVFQEIYRSYSIKAVPTTVKNHSSNSALERMYLSAQEIY